MADIVSIIIKCANFAAIKHRYQRRKNPERFPYVNHPIGVAYILTEEAKITDPEVIQAALLHDTVEDTDTTLEEIEQEFGVNVRNIVAEVTDDKTLDSKQRKIAQITRGRGSTHKAKLVKLADKLYNLRDLQASLPDGWTEERRMEYYEWARVVVSTLKGTNRHLEKSLDAIFQKECRLK